MNRMTPCSLLRIDISLREEIISIPSALSSSVRSNGWEDSLSPLQSPSPARLISSFYFHLQSWTLFIDQPHIKNTRNGVMVQL